MPPGYKMGGRDKVCTLVFRSEEGCYFKKMNYKKKQKNAKKISEFL